MEIITEKDLVSPAATGKPFRKRKRKAIVTIITGIICNDGIVLASDSQTTFGTQKQCDTNKINPVQFVNGWALVAESGDAELSQKAVATFQEFASVLNPTSEKEIIFKAEQAVKSVRQQQIALYQGQNFSLEEWQQEFRDNRPFELMIAFYFNKTPHLYTLSLSTGIAHKINLHYAAIGCGSNLGGYLLAELSTPEMPSYLATPISVYIVESVKKHDAFCGGATKIAQLPNPAWWLGQGNYIPQPHVFSPVDVAKLVKLVSKMDSKTKTQRIKILQDSFSKEAEKLLIQMTQSSPSDESRYKNLK
jgi:20S proteasome alpha/beta subunit